MSSSSPLTWERSSTHNRLTSLLADSILLEFPPVPEASGSGSGSMAVTAFARFPSNLQRLHCQLKSVEPLLAFSQSTSLTSLSLAPLVLNYAALGSLPNLTHLSCVIYNKALA